MITTHNHLSTAKSNANNIGFRGSSVYEEVGHKETDLTTTSSKASLISGLKSAMADVFVNGFNLSYLFHVLSCIKHSETSNLDCVTQDFWPDSICFKCRMRIKFFGKTHIRVTIYRENKCTLRSDSKPTNKNMQKLIDCIQTIEEFYESEL